MRLTRRIRRLPAKLKVLLVLSIGLSVPVVGNYIVAALGLAVAGAALVFYFILVVLPAAALGWFAYHLFLRKLLRARHIERLRLDRLIREANARDTVVRR